MKDIYVEFGSAADIKGETTDEIHKSRNGAAIEVSSFRHEILQPKSSTASTAGGHSAERTEHGELLFTKEIDLASTKLWQACSAGTIYNDVVVYFYRALGGKNTTGSGANTRVNYLKIELKNVLVSSVNTSIISGSELPTEVFGLKYSAIKWTYSKALVDGTTANAAAIGSWNLKNNTVTFAA
jgi:type VI secretion system secreted protein Hcp